GNSYQRQDRYQQAARGSVPAPSLAVRTTVPATAASASGAAPLEARASVSASLIASVEAQASSTARCGTEQLAPAGTARCPRCGTAGEVSALFGFRKINGKARRQSWCRACRRSARSGETSSLVEEAQAFARKSVREAALEELPLWSSVSSTTEDGG
ncbi:MAG: hypothetical protein M3Y59_17285, partial [Myxococcota bacterium]|nr:hypothetical protein [Myxococcota bacterium]